MSSELAIKVENVSKQFSLNHHEHNTIKSIFTSGLKNNHKKELKNTHQALKDISLEIKKGEFFGIVGRNGSGKSTLLKLLAGIYQPDKGSVDVSGRLVPFIELGVGFNPELSGKDNVYLNGAMLGFSKKEVDAFYDEVVDFAELEQFMDQKLKNYSSGMQVRLAFSMAIRAQADVLLVDEVLAVGDADFQRKCFDYFKLLKKNKKTVVFVTHDMDAVREYCDRAALISNAKLETVGSADAIASDYIKLFNPEAKATRGEESHKRWGNGDASIMMPEVSITETEIQLSFTLEANNDIKNAICGFSIKNNEGLNILGTNTKLNRSKPINMRKNERKMISFSFSNFLSEGTYSSDIAIISEDSITVKDWWESALHFIIKKDRHTPALTNPTIKFSIDKAK